MMHSWCIHAHCILHENMGLLNLGIRERLSKVQHKKTWEKRYKMRQDETRWDYVLTCKISTRNPSIKISKSTRLLTILRCTLNFWLHFWVHSWLLLWDLRQTFPAHLWHTRRLVCDLFSTLRADRLSRTSMTHTFSWSQTIGPPQHKCSSMFIM